jgi:hypothetical protein
VKLLWKQAWVLLSVLAEPQFDIKEEWWMEKAKQFAKLFVKRYPAEDITPYIHVLVYHLGFYMETYGNLEIFANYAIEGRHQYNKRMLFNGTNGFGKFQNEKNLPMQQLLRSTREDSARSADAKKYRRKETWATRSLKKFPNIDAFFGMTITADQILKNISLNTNE